MKGFFMSLLNTAFIVYQIAEIFPMATSTRFPERDNEINLTRYTLGKASYCSENKPQEIKTFDLEILTLKGVTS